MVTEFVIVRKCFKIRETQHLIAFIATALAIRKKLRQQVFVVHICQFEGLSKAKI